MLLRTGFAGSVDCGQACVAPMLVIALAAIGLSAVTGYPAFAFFLCITAYVLYRHMRKPEMAKTAAKASVPKPLSRTAVVAERIGREVANTTERVPKLEISGRHLSQFGCGSNSPC